MQLTKVFNRRNRILLRELVITDFKLRYQGSILGYLWSILKPLLLFLILYVVFVHFLRFGTEIEHFPVYLLLGVVLWAFFTESTTQGMNSIIARGDLLRKISFPKYVIVLSSSISALINLMINLMVVLIFVLIAGVEIRITALIIPLLIVQLYIFSLSIAFLLGSLIVRYRDISHLWDVFLQGFFYITPIIYPVSLVVDRSELAAKILLLNPVAQIIQDARYVLITDQSVTTRSLIENDLISAIPYLIAIAILIISSIAFRNSSKYFAENL